MSSAVCNPPPPTFFLDGLGGGGFGSIDQWLAQQAAAIEMEAAEKKDGQFDIWASIQSSKKAAEADAAAAPYVHPLVRRSASSLSQRSLEVCTESLGCETGSDGVLSGDDLGDYSPGSAADEELVDVDDYAGRKGGEITEEAGHFAAAPPPPLREKRKELVAVNYHCSISGRSPFRAFPPPLPSLSRRDGPCLSMRSHRRDGRLVVQAVGAPPQNYLHSRRQDGRLLLTLVETTFQQAYPEEPHMQHCRAEREAAVFDMAAETEETEEEEDEEEEEEEEVEVVDRGILVEVKVSSPPQPQSGALKVQRSSVVINKFVGTAVGEQPAAGGAAASPRSAPRNTGMTTTTTTTATAVVAAAAAASSLVCTDEGYWRYGGRPAEWAQRPPSPEKKLLFTSKRTMNRQELLHQVRSCSEHLRPLFILEPCCIATS